MNDAIHALIVENDDTCRQTIYEIVKQYPVHMTLLESFTTFDDHKSIPPSLIYASLSEAVIPFLKQALRNTSPIQPTVIVGYHPEERELASSILDFGVWALLQKPLDTLLVNNLFAKGIERFSLMRASSMTQYVQEDTHAANIRESLETLAGGIAHDFNNILAIVLSNARLLGKKPENDPAIRSTIVNAAERAVNLTKQLVEYSGKGHFPLKPISDLTPYVSSALQKLQLELPGCPVQLNHSTQILPVYGDTTQIEQVIKNLVYNAAEAIENNNGEVFVETEIAECIEDQPAGILPWEQHPEGESVVIRVRDTGCGISKDEISRVFTPFFSTKFIGRGLGLSAVLGIVRRHGGAITINSEPDQGTEVAVFFPMYPMVGPSDNVAKMGSGVNGTVLVVDDDEICRTLAKTMLEKMGFSTILAKDGLDALSTFKKNKQRIDCVILDMVMPRMNGQTCFREIRKINPNVKIVMASGYDYYDAIGSLTKEGLNGFIAKPYQLGKFKEKLSEVLGIEFDGVP